MLLPAWNKTKEALLEFQIAKHTRGVAMGEDVQTPGEHEIISLMLLQKVIGYSVAGPKWTRIFSTFTANGAKCCQVYKNPENKLLFIFYPKTFVSKKPKLFANKHHYNQHQVAIVTAFQKKTAFSGKKTHVAGYNQF